MSAHEATIDSDRLRSSSSRFVMNSSMRSCRPADRGAGDSTDANENRHQKEDTIGNLGEVANYSRERTATSCSFNEVAPHIVAGPRHRRHRRRTKPNLASPVSCLLLRSFRPTNVHSATLFRRRPGCRTRPAAAKVFLAAVPAKVNFLEVGCTKDKKNASLRIQHPG